MHADTVETADWWARKRDAGGAAWIANYQKSLKARHRDAIVEVVKSLAPETLFEVGSHCGPNLVRIAQEFPDILMHGIDASAEAVKAGREWVTSLGLEKRVQLSTQRFPDGTQATPTGFADVVLSCYTLAYIAPEDLDAALYEMGRLAARAVILAEPMAIDGSGQPPTRNLSGYSEWAHDYQRALGWIGSLRNVTTRIVPIRPSVDRLNAILVVERIDSHTSSTQ